MWNYKLDKEMMESDLLCGLKLEKIEGSNILIARKEILIPVRKELFTSKDPVLIAKQPNYVSYKIKGGIR